MRHQVNNSRAANRPNPTKPTEREMNAHTRPDFFADGEVDKSTAAYHGTMVCQACHAIWQRKRWHLNEQEFTVLSGDPHTTKVTCPACTKIARQDYDGIVALRSPLIRANEADILGLIRNTETRVRERNPMARIASVKVDNDTIEVLTITTTLADHIGKELKKAYDGELESNQTDRSRFMRVMWHRDE
jgi:NMD protein affecting ribosome stability and mRNA decay